MEAEHSELREEVLITCADIIIELEKKNKEEKNPRDYKRRIREQFKVGY